MADNFIANPGADGDTFAADDIGSVKYVRNKLSLGADGSAADAVGGSGVDSTGVQRVSLATDIALPAGTNAIGKLAANSGVDIGDVDVTSQPARDNATDTITASLDTAAIMNDTTALTPKFAAISGATSGNNTLVAAVAAKKIRVLSLTAIAAGEVTFRLEDGAGGSALTGVISLTTNSGFSLNFSPVGHCETTANTLLNMELSAAVQVSGVLTYVEV